MLSHHMFCFQCQETAHHTGCTAGGVCGKSAVTANAMDCLIRQLKTIALYKEPDRKTGRFIIQSLFMTITNANFDDKRLLQQLEKARQLVPDADFNVPLGVLAEADIQVRALRELLIYGIKGIAAYAEHAAVLGHESMEIYTFTFKALRATATERSIETLTELVMECGATALKTMDLLDRANTAAFGSPRITEVRLNAGKRPGILVSGHDLKDLYELLCQTVDSGIDIYTHGEMLAAHYYPLMQTFPHLYGHYGNAWHRQSIEFAAFKGPILMTTNCITPVAAAYQKRIFTTGTAGYPGIPHIHDRKHNKPKDFTPLIALARHSPPPEPLEKGTVSGGFAHAQVLKLADKIIAAIKSGAIRRIIIMAGCDGRHSNREYYTALAQNLPADTIIMTAGCAKFRYNKLQLGEINGIPRILDAGQCNDCYSLIVTAKKLQTVLAPDDINKLPISFDIAWYEQKAVTVLLALLASGFKNIRLGPSLPAFLSPEIVEMLAKNFGLKGISDVDTDLHALLKGK